MPPKKEEKNEGKKGAVGGENHGPDPEQCFADTKRRAAEGIDWL
jgi:hypothetical protein